MSDWIHLPENPGVWPHKGEIVYFRRNGELSEPLVVASVDPKTKTVYFEGSIPHDVTAGDELVGINIATYRS